MRGRWPYVVLIAAYGAGAADAAELTPLPPIGVTGIERGIASLRCAAPAEGVFSMSRGAILDVGGAADVLLTTAHGLPPDAERVKRDCRVLVRGKPHAIAEVWHAGGDRLGPEHDWAVIVTERIPGDVHRWRVGRVTTDWLVKAASQRAPVKLVLRSADSSRGDCRLEQATSNRDVLVAHSCVTYPGVSGSPMVVGLAVDPEPVLIAMHVGTQVRWIGTKLEFVSVARPLDDEVVTTIEAAATQTVAARSGRRRAWR